MPSRDSTRRPPWAVLTVITSAMGAGPLFNFGLASTSALVLEKFGITSAQFGAILTVVFASAAVVSLVLGWLADRLPPHTQFAILFGGAALSLFVAGLAPTYGFLLATAVFSGISQAMSNPTTNRAVSALAPPGKRTDWIGVKQSGVQFSQFAAGLVFPPLAVWFGWSGAAIIVSVLCVVLLVAASVVVPDWTKRDATAPADAPTASPRAAAPATGALLLPVPPRDVWRIIALLAAISFLSAFGIMATNAYLALFAVQQFGFPLWLGGIVVAVGGIIGVVSRIWWGRQLARGTAAGALFVAISLGAIGAAVTLIISAYAHVAWLVWVAVTLHGISVLGTNVVTNSSVMRIAGGTRLGLATGVTATGMYTGFATGPIVAGALIDAVDGFGAGWLVVGAVYLACLAVSIVFARYTRRFRRR